MYKFLIIGISILLGLSAQAAQQVKVQLDCKMHNYDRPCADCTPIERHDRDENAYIALALDNGVVTMLGQGAQPPIAAVTWCGGVGIKLGSLDTEGTLKYGADIGAKNACGMVFTVLNGRIFVRTVNFSMVEYIGNTTLKCDGSGFLN